MNVNIPAITAVILSLVIGAGALSGYFRRAQGQETIKLLQANVVAYKDAEKLKDQRIAYLEGQLYQKDQIIERLTDDSNKSRNRK